MKIIQMTNMTHVQSMGYVFQAASGHVLVIDGGHYGNDFELQRLIESVGGHVHLWLITHPHVDHFAAVVDLMHRETGVTFDRLGSGIVSDEWGLASVDNDGDDIVKWNSFVPELGDRFFEIKEGQSFALGSMKVEILAGTNPDLTMNPINNQSCVIRVTEGDFSMIMLGDLGWRRANAF